MNTLRSYFLTAGQFDACIRAAKFGKDFDGLSPMDRLMCTACSIKLHKIVELQRDLPFDPDRASLIIFEHADEMEEALGHAWVCLAMLHTADPGWEEVDFPNFDKRIAHSQASGGELFTVPGRKK